MIFDVVSSNSCTQQGLTKQTIALLNNQIKYAYIISLKLNILSVKYFQLFYFSVRD